MKYDKNKRLQSKNEKVLFPMHPPFMDNPKYEMPYLSFGFIKRSNAQIKEGYDPIVLCVPFLTWNMM